MTATPMRDRGTATATVETDCGLALALRVSSLEGVNELAEEVGRAAAAEDTTGTLLAIATGGTEYRG